jgi:deoxyribodipyrimidine photo-lyase
MKGLFIFRRDLRIQDNTGLNELSKQCIEINCIFILDPKQIDPKQNKFFSAPAMLFMIDTLIELKTKIPIKILYGDPYKVILSLKNNYDLIAYNKDYTKYAIERDNKLDELGCIGYHDLGLNSPVDIKPYKVFTPYYIAASNNPVRKPITYLAKIKDFKHVSVDLNKLRTKIINMLIKMKMDLSLLQPGGRTAAIKCIKKFKCKEYSKSRDLLTFETSRLGPHLKFGTISAREVYYACNSDIFRKQLYWRDFYMQIGYHFPNVYGYNFKNNIKWTNNVKHFIAWCKGETGYDIVDACMNQLNKSGFMHNRGRMIVSSFLTKILHIDWRWGEQYFATKLTDYDPANNNGGWQWSAGTGVDAQPYFRIFNPYTQAKKFDPMGTYRKKWLTRKPIKEIVNYQVEREKALKLIVH